MQQEIVKRLQSLLSESLPPLKAVNAVSEEFRISADILKEEVLAAQLGFSKEVTDYLRFSLVVEEFAKGTPEKVLAFKFHCPESEINKIILINRANKLHEIESELRAPDLDARLEKSPVFTRLNAKIRYLEGVDETAVCGNAPSDNIQKVVAPPGLPPYLAKLYEYPVMSGRREQFLFEKYNYLKYRARKHLIKMRQEGPDDNTLNLVEKIYKDALDTRNEIISHSLRLVVSVAARTDKSQELNTRISDGNQALMRAVDTFDYSKGNRFSTYATYAVQRSLFRIHSQRKQAKERIPLEEGKDLSFIKSSSLHPLTRLFAKECAEGINTILSGLRETPRKVIEMYYGLNGRMPMNYVEIAESLGISYKAASAIGQRATAKLTLLAMEKKIPLPFEIINSETLRPSAKTSVRVELNEDEKTVAAQLNPRVGKTAAEIKSELIRSENKNLINRVDQLLTNLINKNVARLSRSKFRIFLRNPSVEIA